MYLICRNFYHLSANEAETQVKNLLFTGFGIWKKSEIEPPVSDVLRDKCFKILQKNFMLSEDTVSFCICNDYGFFAMNFDIVTSFDDDAFKLTAIQLKKCMYNYITSFGYAPLVKVYYEQHAQNEYYFFLCYACTEKCKTCLSDFIRKRNNVARQNALNHEKPVTDNALEKELEDMKNGKL